jgi:hypothetical protein
MWVSPERGALYWTRTQFEQFLGLHAIDASEVWNELSTSGVGEFEMDANGHVTVKCRRLLREEGERKQGRERQQRFRSRHSNVTSNGDVTRIYHISESKDDKSSEKADSKKGKDLDLKIKEAADPIYKSDPVKFHRLGAWIRTAERHPYPPEAIAAALAKFNGYSSTVKAWWSYLNTMVDQVYKDQCFAEHLAEHQEHKAEWKR